MRRLQVFPWIGVVLIELFLFLPNADSRQGARGARYAGGGSYIGGDPSMSPDGSQIVFGSPHDGVGDIYVMNSDGSNQKRLTFTPEYEGEPEFSPDGSHIVFVSERDGHGHIYIMNADGSSQRALTDTAYDDGEPSFSSDGLKIAFTRMRKIFVMNSDGSNPKQLVTDSIWDGSPSFSPDGTKIIHHSVVYDPINSDAEFQVRIMDAVGTDSKLLQADASNPTFSLDGKKIVFVSGRYHLYEYEISMMDVDGSNVRRLTHAGGFTFSPKFTPDGSKIIFLEVGHGGRHGEIKIMNVDGSGLKTITKIY